MTATQQVNFDVSKADARIIKQIVTRTMKVAKENGIDYAKQDCEMDLTACHANGCPLRLADLLNADDANFGHDVFGIRRFINRKTGKIDPAKFHPRYAKRD